MSEFKLADKVLKYPGGSASAGFNRRVLGDDYAEAFRYQSERQDRELYAGWSLADRMINEGKLFYVRPFHHLECPAKSGAFQYGGSWVCNACNRSGVDREWWKIKVFMDGNAWCCIGTDFENLQESEDYAFGDTREEAIENYGKSMLGLTKVQVESTAQETVATE